MADITRKLGISEATFYVWKIRFGTLGAPEIRELRQLRDENAKLKTVVADLTLDRAVLQDVIKKSGRLRSPQDGSATYSQSLAVERTTCMQILGVNRRAVSYQSVRGDVDVALLAGIKAIAAVRIRYGQRRIHVLLRREGWPVNIKRAARLYRGAGLAIRTKTPRRRRAAGLRETPAHPTATNRVGRWTSCTMCSPTARRSGSKP